MNRKTALCAVLIILAVVCLFSFVMGALSDCAPSEHDCHGEDCFLCLCLSLAEHASAWLTLLAFSVAGVCLLAQKAACHTADALFSATTPVRLKVKLSD